MIRVKEVNKTTTPASRLTSRKFILACAGLVISTGLVLLGKMTDGIFVSFNSILAGAYMTSNVVSRISDNKRGGK